MTTNAEPLAAHHSAQVRRIAEQHDMQAALHRLNATGDWSELNDLSDPQLQLAAAIVAIDSFRARIAAILETRHAQ